MNASIVKIKCADGRVRKTVIVIFGRCNLWVNIKFAWAELPIANACGELSTRYYLWG